jgi:hypothetical protein
MATAMKSRRIRGANGVPKTGDLAPRPFRRSIDLISGAATADAPSVALIGAPGFQVPLGGDRR